MNDVSDNNPQVANISASSDNVPHEVRTYITDSVAAASTSFNAALREQSQQIRELLGAVKTLQTAIGNPTTPIAASQGDSDALPVRQPHIETHSEPLSESALHTRAVMKATVHPPKPFDGRIDGDVEHFLRKMKHYLRLCGIPADDQLDFAAQYLEGQPDKLWSSEKDILALSKHPVALDWSDFETFLQKHFGKIAPMTDYFKEYEDLKQETTVIDYVSRLRTCVSKLKGTFLEPNEGAVCVKFLRGLKPHINKLVQNTAPDGWWNSVDQVYAKALTFETNKAAMMDKTSFDAERPSEKRKERPASGNDANKLDKLKKKQKMLNPDSAIKIPKDEWMRRLRNKRCVMCGKAKHGMCSNKVATPFKE